MNEVAARGWRNSLIWFGVVTGLWSLMSADALIAMVDKWWTSATFNHALLIPPIIAWLVWDRRALVAQVMPRPWIWGLLPLAGALLLWLLGWAAGVLVAQQFAWVFGVQALVLTLLGVNVARALLFPLGYMLFLVPAGEFLIPPLQHFTADFIVWGLGLVGIPVYLDNIYLSTPSGNFEVAEACSGVRFLIATLALGALFAQTSFKSWRRRLAVMALALLVPVIANGLRAFGIVYIAYLTDNKYAAGVDHIVYGWGFFAAVTLLLLVIGMTFADKSVNDPAFDVSPLLANQQTGRGLIHGVAALLLILGVSGYGALLDHRAVATQPIVLDPMVAKGDWTATAMGNGFPWRPYYAGATAETMAYFMKDGERVDVYAALYADQREGAEMVAWGNGPLGGEDRWIWLANGNRRVEWAGRELEVATMLMRGPGNMVRESWRVYWVGGRLTSSDKMAKLLGAWARLTGSPAAGVLVIAAEQPDEANPVGDRLAALVADLPDPALYFAAARNGKP